ncbi:1-aminocyclopropane-1-carboxylate deaminase/D-cysteine desulfhydrase [Nocardioides marmoribigeumensis]|uniref:D-cysteine desulfhydrase n=1 Tax=Nocardioides marmoribigeumensis TaxID=433649 RepID=A0ABU2BUG1_9ACTN|nr:pyridoxal-phosphate dependent enzyme [Nocardioides marmoribigeumensis]MDR7362265.1 D-cysteine desulfhydrase [Nocardioides marmoribigeumensis]
MTHTPGEAGTAPPTRLHRRLPGLDLGHVRLGSGPSPVRELGAELGVPAGLWVKDDGAYGDGPWGGNKVRKLEWILPEAQRRGEQVLFSVGGIGTHWGLALATYARRLGLKTLLGLVDQPVDDHVREQLARLLTSGAEIHRFSSPARLRAAAPWLLWRGHRGRRLPWYLPAGGSNPFGTLAYVDTALEIADQVATGELPEPGTVVVPVGSGGTVAGLTLGLRLAGLRSRVLGVVVNDALRLDAEAMAGLATRTAELLTSRGAGHLAPVSPADLDLRTDWLGTTYGDPTPASQAAVRDAARAGLGLEPVYTGKALAAVRDLHDRLDGPVLWVQTHGPR